MRRKFICIICILLAGFILFGCSSTSVDEKVQRDVITVKDTAGRQVKVPKDVKRIACLYAVSGHTVALLGKGNNIVSVVEGLKRDIVLNEICPSIGKASAPKAGGAINMEELVKSKPDVAFVDMQTSFNKSETEKLDKFKIPYLAIDFNSIKGQREVIQLIANVIGEDVKIKKYNELYDGCINLVTDRIKDIPKEKRIRVYHSVNEATRTDPKESLSTDIIQLAGGIDVSVDEKLNIVEDKYFASIEQILLWDPEVIMVNEQGVDQYIIKNEQWKNIKAVKDNKVIKMPNGISRWGHPNSIETPLAILWVAKTLYPEKFMDIDIGAETKKFYLEFFNYNLSDDMVNKILSGNGMRLEKK